MDEAAGLRRPGVNSLLENQLTDAVARLREREGDVRVEAFELRRIPGAADAGVE